MMKRAKMEIRICLLAAIATGMACKSTKKTVDPRAMAASCPDLLTPETVAQVDFRKEFALSATTAAKYQAVIAAAAELVSLSRAVEDELKAACISISRELGTKADYESAESACKTAGQDLGVFRQVLGADAKLAVSGRPPQCALPMSAMSDCAAVCDPDAEVVARETQCEGELAGECNGKCSGTCRVEAGTRCDGACDGVCEGTVSGKCDGACTGRCDGKSARGVACAGKCDGKCAGDLKGTCKGACRGNCAMRAPASCGGACVGQCSAGFVAPRCSGTIALPKASAECRARCGAAVLAAAQCRAASVNVEITNASNAEAQQGYEAAVEQHAPAVLKIALGLRDRLRTAVADVTGAVKKTQAALERMKKDGVEPARLVACAGRPFRAALVAGDRLNADVKAAAELAASLSSAPP